MLLKKEKETQVKFSPGFSANRPSNNWAQIFCGIPSLGRLHAVCSLQSANVIHRKSGSHNRNLTLVSLLQ